MRDYLRVIEPSLSPPLFSVDALSSIQSLTKFLPTSSLAGFECRLRDDQPEVDFQMLLSSLEKTLPEELHQLSVWQNLQILYQDLFSTDKEQQVQRIGLEFDTNCLTLNSLIPCIFLQFDPKASITSQDFVELVNKLLHSKVSERVASNIRTCFDSLPSESWISHMGCMFSRKTNAVRVNIRGIDPTYIPSYLETIGWYDPHNRLSTLISDLNEMLDSILLSFDVSDTIQPRIGLECFIHSPVYKNSQPWQIFLDYLIENDLCSPAKKNALLNWPNKDLQPFDTSLWSKDLSWWAYSFLASNADLIFKKRIHHIKLIYQQNNFTEAKGYLAFRSKWTKRGNLESN